MQMAELLEKANQIPSLDDKAFAILLNEKTKRAEEVGIALELEVNRESSGIPSVELCSLVSNLLDNAIEAVQKVKEDKYIRFSFYVNLNKQTTEICCENPYEKCPVEKDGRFFTIKKDKQNHGIGIQNIRKIVEKNHGVIKISYDTDFCVHISFPHQFNEEKSAFLKQNRNTGECLCKYSEGR